MEAESIYDPVSMRITSFSGWLNRWLHRTYGWVTGETPFVSALRAGKLAVEKRDKVRGGYHLTVASTEAAFNARHRYRRKLLEAEARERDWVLIGAANRSEWLVGWYVQGGVDHLPLQPLIGLYKTQIRQLAAYLGLPEEVRRQAPSPDMRKGITDEFALGLPYWKIDLVLDYLDGGLNEVQITSAGVTQREMAHVQQMHMLSEWKRDPQTVPPPVEGTISGGYRKTLPEGIPAAWSGTRQ
jgi:NAD+ synthase